jgi:hypothetical protein
MSGMECKGLWYPEAESQRRRENNLGRIEQMTTSSQGWSDNSMDYLDRTWATVVGYVNTTCEVVLDAVASSLALFSFIALIPALAHGALALFIMMIGAPCWFVVTFLFCF